ncbi:MAG TPA: winged helix-turn-helix transcriptional regulator [Candidatus Nitrosocosmicus sp.]|nr:winged helix-turn-helix transcriptional regulator [Candidatus Nitrosocosmicus sp.]
MSYILTRRLKNNKSLIVKRSKNDKTNQSLEKYNKSVSALFDEINIQILQELFKNYDIKSSEISLKLKIPLSTIQRRRNAIEKSGFLQHKFEIDPKKFGFRSADLLVDVSKGDCEEIAKEILNQYRKNILQITIRIGSPKINLIATVFYKDTDEVFDIMQHVRRMEHVENVEWSEVVKIVLKNDSGILKSIFE